MTTRRWVPPSDARPGDTLRAGRRLWSAAEDAVLRAEYPHQATAPLAKRLRRPLSSTYQRARALGLRKSAVYLASPAACRLRRGDHVGASSRFLKGHVPANKGLRRPGWSAGRMRDTQFKQGQFPYNRDPEFYVIGALRVNADGYIDMRVSFEPGAMGWRALHRILWEDAHGPIPRGCIVVFKDRDRLNVELGNLELITLRTNMRRNTIHNLPKPVARAVQLLGALNRQIRKKERQYGAHD